MERKSTQETFPTDSPSKNPSLLDFDQHKIQCNCNLQKLNFISKKYHSIFSKPKFTSCWRARNWLSVCTPPRNSYQIYERILNSQLETQQFFQSLKQISLDVSRTYPDQPYFLYKGGQQVLRRCLIAFSKYDHTLSYVQGMNFIMAALLWHASQSDAFWLFVGLMEDFQLRDTYLPMFPGLSKHCQIIQLLTFDFLPDLHRILAVWSVSYQMLATDWCFTLFGNAIPAEQMHHIFDRFFDRGWYYFYQIVIVLLKYFQERMESEEDPIEILSYLKMSQKTQREWKKFLEVLDGGKGAVTWRIIAERALTINIDVNYIKELHQCFNIRTRQFDFTRKPSLYCKIS